MQDRPVVVREGGNGVAMFGIVAIVLIVAVAMFVWQPWNANAGSHTTIITQPAAPGGANAGAGTSGAGTSGSSSSGAGSTSGGTSGSAGANH